MLLQEVTPPLRVWRIKPIGLIEPIEPDKPNEPDEPLAAYGQPPDYQPLPNMPSFTLQKVAF